MNVKPALVALFLVTTPEATAPSPERIEAPAPRMAEENGSPWLRVEDRHAVPSRYRGFGRQELLAGTVRARSLATADFDEDGMPDVVAGYAARGGGLFALHRGNVDAVYPNAPEARERRSAGTSTRAAFLPDTDVFETPGRADFIGAGDFDADGHQDVVTASRGGSELWLHAGNGNGRFADPERVELPGQVTAFVTGEINRRDGLADLVVGVDGNGGPKAIVFEDPHGALRGEPESLNLTAPATDLVLAGLTDNPMVDLVVAAGTSLVIVHGRDRKLSYEVPEEGEPPRSAEVEAIDLAFEIESLAVGDFDGDLAKDLALLDTEGSLHMRPALEAALFAEVRPEEIAGTPASSGWKGTHKPAVGEARRARLLPVRMSTLPGDDLVMLDRPGRQLLVRLAAGERPSDPHEEAMRTSAGTWATWETPSPGAAVLPMRLNGDALTDLVVLSEGASGLETFEPGIESTFTVTNINDSGAGSLRDAIILANAAPGADTIDFNIPGVAPHTIQPLTPLPVVGAGTVIDGTTQPDFGATPVVMLDGNLAGSSANGLELTGGSSTVRGLVIGRFTNGVTPSPAGGIYLNGGSTYIIEGNYVGTDPAGTAAQGNFPAGIYGSGVSLSTIGGTTVAGRNLVSGQSSTTPPANGIVLSGPGSSGNVIAGNYVGTTASGMIGLGNAVGIEIAGTSPSNAVIGGTTAGSRNVISANDEDGLVLGTGSGSCLVQGNLIGLAQDGSTLLGNLDQGILVSSSASNTIGGTTPAARNIISGNLYGVYLENIGSNLNLVQGNYIGSDEAGLAERGNGAISVDIVDAPDNVIGSAFASGRNLITGAGASQGVWVVGNNATGNQILGNFMGTDVTGTVALRSWTGSAANGVFLLAPNNQVGGSTLESANVIAEYRTGVSINGSQATGNLVEMNLIGTDVTGTLDFGGVYGVRIDGGASSNTVGVALGQGNVISASNWGVWIEGQTTTGNKVQGNLIGTDLSGTAALPTGDIGVVLIDTQGNTIGGTTPSQGNLISGNPTDGIRIQPDSSRNNVVSANLIGTDINGTNALPNGNGIRIANAAETRIGGSLSTERNVISGNTGNGIIVSGTIFVGNEIRGNLIGTDVSGQVPLGNGGNGILISERPNTVIGGASSDDRNVISGNAGDGVRIEGVGGFGTILQANYIGLDIDGLTTIPNTNGVHLLGGPALTTLGVPGGPPNVISGNSTGIFIEDAASTLNTIVGNLIGTDASGSLDLGNGIGIYLLGTSNNMIGGPGAGDRNVISGNGNNLVIDSAAPPGNIVEGNWIGPTADGTGVLGSSSSAVAIINTQGTLFTGNVVLGAASNGLSLLGSSATHISGNWIGADPAFTLTPGNGGAGILVNLGSSNSIGGYDPMDWNRILGSGSDGIQIVGGSSAIRIFQNLIGFSGDLGIDLEDDGVTPNDPGDPDGGSNNRQNFPVIASATTTSGGGTVAGTLDSTPSSSFSVDVYHSVACDASGHGEGETPIGTALVSTDGSGSATFSVGYLAVLNPGEVVAAVARNASTGDTSEFSMCQALAAAPPSAITAGAFTAGSSNFLTWPEAPGATLYHVYAGSAPTISRVASGLLDTCELGSTITTSFATPVTDVPPPGEVLWYVIRPEGPYGLGDVDESSSGPRMQDSIGSCGSSCAHDTCATGAALTSPCDPCVAMIEEADNFCTTSSWDGVCVSEVQSVCGSMRCTASQGTCAHPLCSTGAVLSPGCDVPPLADSCVARICGADPFCCGTSWDSVCVSEVATVCSLGCL